jgi:Rps23 Pro-64 3,4-dihydroxylase Tpa1-like proline 4-hydroxylase
MLKRTSDIQHAEEPFVWHLAKGLLSQEQLRALERERPGSRAGRRAVVEGSRRDKQYRMNVLTLVDQNARTPACDSLSPSWKALLDDLESEEFLDWLSKSTGVDLHGLPSEIGVYTYTENDYISLHKDKPTKALTAILYLNEDWPADGGGDFEVRASGRSADAPVESVPPVGGQLLAFPPSDTSWHAVSKVRTGEVTRLTVQLEFWLHES